MRLPALAPPAQVETATATPAPPPSPPLDAARAVAVRLCFVPHAWARAGAPANVTGTERDRPAPPVHCPARRVGHAARALNADPLRTLPRRGWRHRRPCARAPRRPDCVPQRGCAQRTAQVYGNRALQCEARRSDGRLHPRAHQPQRRRQRDRPRQQQQQLQRRQMRGREPVQFPDALDGQRRCVAPVQTVVYCAVGANARLDDNTALCAALEHYLATSALYRGDGFALVATRAATLARPAAVRDLDRAARARGTHLVIVDDVARYAERVGDGLTRVFASPRVATTTGAVDAADDAAMRALARSARVQWCAHTPEACAPREAPRWLPPPPSMAAVRAGFATTSNCTAPVAQMEVALRCDTAGGGHISSVMRNLRWPRLPRLPTSSESAATPRLTPRHEPCVHRREPLPSASSSSPSSSLSSAHCESSARAQLAHAVQRARNVDALRSRLALAVSAGVLSRARIHHAWTRARRVERALSAVAVAGATASVGARTLLDTAAGADAHAIYDVNGSHKRELRWDADRRHYVFRERTGDRNYETEMRGFFGRKWAWMKQSFLPEDVTDDYYAFAKWRVFQRLLSSTVGVFGTQALLLALGVKSGNKISQAATISWVLKDGLSRVGKMLWASQLGRDMDADPKRFRFYSALLYSLGNGLEITTRIVPQSFLLLATAANTAKLCSMLTASATRNSMYRSFAGRNENIADITAKGEAQITIADIGGMALGIQLSKLIGTSRPNVVATYIVLSTVDLIAIWQELRVVEFRTLNLQRSCLVVEQYLRDGTVPTPKEASKRERILLPEPLPRQAFKPITRLVQNEEQMRQLMQRFKGERFLLRNNGIVLRDDSKPSDIFRAIVAWTLVKKGHATEEEAPARMRAVAEPLQEMARASGWRVFVYPKFRRRASW